MPDDVQPLNATDDAGRDTRASVQGGPGSAQQYGVVFVVMTGERTSAGGFVTWQVKMWELRLPAPAEQPTKPNPSKT